MRTLRRITVATALAATALVSPVHAKPPPPGVTCATLPDPVHGICTTYLPPDGEAYYFANCVAQRVDPTSSPDQGGLWTFNGAVLYSQYIARVVAHCDKGATSVSQDNVTGPLGYVAGAVAAVDEADAGDLVCTWWEVWYVEPNPFDNHGRIVTDPDGRCS